MLNAAHYNVTTPVAQPESFVANASFYAMLRQARAMASSDACWTIVLVHSDASF